MSYKDDFLDIAKTMKKNGAPKRLYIRNTSAMAIS